MKVPSLSPNDTCSIRASKCVGETSLAAKLLCIPQARFIWNVFKLKYRKNLNNFKEWSEAPLHLFIPWGNLMDLPINQGFPSGSAIKNLPAMQETQETWFWSLGQEDPLQEGMATHSNIFAWRIPVDRGAWWANSPWGPIESDMTQWLSTHAHTYYQVPNLNYKAYFIIKTYESLFLLCLSRCLFRFSGPPPLLNNTEARLQALWYHSMFLFITPISF